MTIRKKITTAIFFTALGVLLLSATIDLNNLHNYSNQPLPSHISSIFSGFDNVPPTNLMDDKIATLGRVLFYDKHLSTNNTVACAGCHQQENAFGVLALQGTGVNGLTLRRPMRLVNLRYKESIEGFFWDERSPDLEDLATKPVQDHIEMGYSGTGGDPGINDMITKLQGLSYYNTLFTFAYGDNTVTKNRVEKALAQFLRSIQSYDSKFDAGMQATGDHLAPFPNFTAAENAGKALFSTDAIKSGGQRTGGGTGCFHCHNPVNFHFIVEKKNNGVTTEIDGSAVLNITKAPSLRDVFNPLGQLNGPLFHNGQATNFSALLSNYNTISPNANLDIRMTINGDLNLTTLERSELQAFIKTLSGSDIYTNPRWSDPFEADGSITVSTATGIVDYTRYKVKAYPTLAHDFVTIDGLPDNGGQALNVISAEGRSVISGAIWGGERIDVSALPAGFYTILITNEKSQLVLSQKIIKN